jgi:hypothetical protein
MEQDMSNFVSSFLSAADPVPGLAYHHMYCGSLGELTQNRWQIERTLRELRALHEKSLLFGVPSPPPTLMGEKPPRARTWEEWQWDLKRAIKDLVEACGQLAERIIALAPSGGARWNGEEKDRDWHVETARVLQAMQDVLNEQTPLMLDAKNRLYNFEQDLHAFERHVQALPAPTPQAAVATPPKASAEEAQEERPKSSERVRKDGQNARGGPRSQEEPIMYLIGWREILAALKLDPDEKRQRSIKQYNEDHGGPIIFSGQGSQPKVVREKLIEWWNRLEIIWEDQKQQKEGAHADAEAGYKYGRSGTAAPGVAGSVKPRRSDLGQPR